jgi:hypothetical protein
MSALDSWYSTNPVWGAVSDWANRNKDNSTATAAANDLFVGAARSSIQRDSDVAYSRSMISPMLDLQRGQQGIATEANMRDIAAKGAVAQDLERIKGDTFRDVQNIEAGANRYGADQNLAGRRYEADSADRRTGMETDAQRYGVDKNLDGRRYEADSAERRTGMETASMERQIGLRGGEDRATLKQGTDETLRLRTDARGAIRDTGRKWFG